MRTHLLSFASLLLGCGSLVLVAGCGGKFVGADGDGGGSDASSGDSGGSGNDGSTGADGGVGRDASAGDGGGPSCTELQKHLDELRLAARKCCPTCNAQQCTIAVADLCCSIGASMNHQAEADAFSQAVKYYEQQCGPVACPATPCRVEPSLVCNPTTSLCD